jgi:hypothetical protein
MVIALAGRRVSGPGARPQLFPESYAAVVRERLEAIFREVGATALVASGACGADLLAMEAAGALGLRRRMVLPFARDQFRDGSVVDDEYQRDWGRVFDGIADAAEARGDLIVLGREGIDGKHEAYTAASRAILDHAQRLAGETSANTEILAVVVWDGQSRGKGDVTYVFWCEAKSRGIPVRSIPTLANAGPNT